MTEVPGISKIWIPAPSSYHADCTGDVKGAWVYPWQAVCWHVEHRGGHIVISGYTIITRAIREEIYNV